MKYLNCMEDLNIKVKYSFQIIWFKRTLIYLYLPLPLFLNFAWNFSLVLFYFFIFVDYVKINSRWRLLEPSDLFGYHLPNRECQLCQKLNGIYLDNIYSPVNKYGDFKRGIYEKPVEPEIVTSLKDWVFGSESAECLV